MKQFFTKLFTKLLKKHVSETTLIKKEPTHYGETIPGRPLSKVYSTTTTGDTGYCSVVPAVSLSKLPKPRKSRRKTTKTLAISKRCYKIQFIGGDLDGRIQDTPIPRPEDRPNPKYLNKSLWISNGKGGWNKTNNYYVAEKVGRPKKGQVIRYTYTPNFVPKKI